MLLWLHWPNAKRRLGLEAGLHLPLPVQHVNSGGEDRKRVKNSKQQG